MDGFGAQRANGCFIGPQCGVGGTVFTLDTHHNFDDALQSFESNSIVSCLTSSMISFAYLLYFFHQTYTASGTGHDPATLPQSIVTPFQTAFCFHL